MKQRLAVIFAHLPPEAQYSWVLCARHLHEQGIFDVRIFTLSDVEIKDYLFLKERNRKNYWMKYLIYRVKGVSNPKTKALHWKLFEFNPDIAHFINSQMIPDFEGLLKEMKTKIFSSFRGYDLLVRTKKDKNWKAYTNHLFEFATGLHFVSEYIKNRAIHMGADKAKCKTIYQGVDTDFFKKEIEHNISDTISILSVGRLTWEKGFIYALEVMSRLKKSGYKFIYKIYGDGPEESHLRYHIERLDLEDYCHLMGRQEKSIILEALDRAHIYFHPSLSDALPNSILEASSMELPIVATKAGGIPECVIHEETGYLTAIADIEELTNYLRILIGNSKLRSQFGQKGRDFMKNEFSLSREFQIWKNFYNGFSEPL